MLTAWKDHSESQLYNHILNYFTEFHNLLISFQDSDLERMYTLCDRVENGLDELRLALEKHIARQGEAALDKICDMAVNVSV